MGGAAGVFTVFVFAFRVSVSVARRSGSGAPRCSLIPDISYHAHMRMVRPHMQHLIYTTQLPHHQIHPLFPLLSWVPVIFLFNQVFFTAASSAFLPHGKLVIKAVEGDGVGGNREVAGARDDLEPRLGRRRGGEHTREGKVVRREVVPGVG